MKPFRKNVAIAIDGGGIKGLIVTRALAILEDYLGYPAHSVFRLTSGTSTGSIVAAGIAAGLTGAQMSSLYLELGATIFQKSWRSILWPLTRYRYPIEPLEATLQEQIGNMRMGDLWTRKPATDVVITTFDLVDNQTRFIKPWKEEYEDWPLSKAVVCSCVVPTFFPIVEGRYVDGGVGGYANPCYLAAYELLFCLGWNPAETTLISLGTGRGPYRFEPEQTNKLWAWQWIEPLLGAFLQSADDQQIHLVNTFFLDLDFRRFQVNLNENISMDDVSDLARLVEYGNELGQMILNDATDPIQAVSPKKAPPS